MPASTEKTMTIKDIDKQLAGKKPAPKPMNLNDIDKYEAQKKAEAQKKSDFVINTLSPMPHLGHHTYDVLLNWDPKGYSRGQQIIPGALLRYEARSPGEMKRMVAQANELIKGKRHVNLDELRGKLRELGFKSDYDKEESPAKAPAQKKESPEDYDLRIRSKVMNPPGTKESPTWGDFFSHKNDLRGKPAPAKAGKYPKTHFTNPRGAQRAESEGIENTEDEDLTPEGRKAKEAAKAESGRTAPEKTLKGFTVGDEVVLPKLGKKGKITSIDVGKEYNPIEIEWEDGNKKKYKPEEIQHNKRIQTHKGEHMAEEEKPPQENAPAPEAPAPEASAPVEQEATLQPEAPPEEAPEAFDAKGSIEQLKTALEELNNRVSMIQEALDSLAAEEEEESAEMQEGEEKVEVPATPTPPGAEPEAAPAGPEQAPAPEKEEKMAQHSKDTYVAELEGRVKTLEAQFAKQGVRKTIQSSSKRDLTPDEMASNEMEAILKKRGII